MESVHTSERHEINNILKTSIAENDYTPLTGQDAMDVRNAIRE
jgi:hypothetical protein